MRDSFNATKKWLYGAFASECAGSTSAARTVSEFNFKEQVEEYS